MHIGELIKSVAEEKGISANELAKRIYYNRQRVVCREIGIDIDIRKKD